jgi:hypothetical protein
MTHSPLKYKSADDCPDVSKHTVHPTGYVAHSDWAEKKIKTHEQHRCLMCGFWAIWKRKRVSP